MDYGFEYVMRYHGLCSESSYSYVAKTRTWECSSKRSACTGNNDPISSYRDVSQNNESQLEAAVSQGPVSITIEADQNAFQLYKSGILTANYRCGTNIDHG